MPRIGYGGGLSGDAVWVEVGLALKGLAPILRRKLGQNRKSVMKVVTLKNIPEVPAPDAGADRPADHGVGRIGGVGAR